MSPPSGDPEGYQWVPDTMTACLYTWFNGNDPDDMFYWHSSQIPDSPTGSGGNAIAFFHEYNFQAEIDELTEAAPLKRTRRSARRSTTRSRNSCTSRCP